MPHSSSSSDTGEAPSEYETGSEYTDLSSEYETGPECMEEARSSGELHDGTPHQLPWRAQPGAAPRVYIVKSDSKLRAGPEQTSQDLGIVRPGTRIIAIEEHLNAAGTLRVRCDKGWLSVKASTGVVLLQLVREGNGTESGSEYETESEYGTGSEYESDMGTEEKYTEEDDDYESGSSSSSSSSSSGSGNGSGSGSPATSSGVSTAAKDQPDNHAAGIFDSDEEDSGEEFMRKPTVKSQKAAPDRDDESNDSDMFSSDEDDKSTNTLPSAAASTPKKAASVPAPAPAGDGAESETESESGSGSGSGSGSEGLQEEDDVASQSSGSSASSHSSNSSGGSSRRGSTASSGSSHSTRSSASSSASSSSKRSKASSASQKAGSSSGGSTSTSSADGSDDETEKGIFDSSSSSSGDSSGSRSDASGTSRLQQSSREKAGGGDAESEMFSSSNSDSDHDDSSETSGSSSVRSGPSGANSSRSSNSRSSYSGSNSRSKSNRTRSSRSSSARSSRSSATTGSGSSGSSGGGGGGGGGGSNSGSSKFGGTSVTNAKKGSADKVMQLEDRQQAMTETSSRKPKLQPLQPQLSATLLGTVPSQSTFTMKSPTYTIAVHAAAYGLEWKVGRSLIEFKELSDRLQRFAIESDARAQVDCAFPASRGFGRGAAAREQELQQLQLWLSELLSRHRPTRAAKWIQEFLGAGEILNRAEEQRQRGHELARMQRKWARLGGAVQLGPSTALHRYARSGNAAMIRSTLKEWSGEYDWLDSNGGEPLPPGSWAQRPGYRTPARSAEEEKQNMETLSLVELLHADVVAPIAVYQEPGRMSATCVGDGRPSGHGVDGGDARGWTAYHLACASGHTEAVLALVTAGGCRTELRTAKTAADGGDVAEKGLTGWALARRNGCEGVDQLLTKLAKGQGSGGSSLPVVAKEALRLERRLLSQGGGVAMRTGKKRSESKSLLKLAERTLMLSAIDHSSSSNKPTDTTLCLADRKNKKKASSSKSTKHSSRSGRSGGGTANDGASRRGATKRTVVPKATI